MRALAKQGHKVSLIAKELGSVHSMVKVGEFDVFQSPIFIGKSGAIATRSYADILKNHGYANPQTLAPLIAGWQSLFNVLNPDAVVFDFAPTAQLACLERNIPTFVLGGGYFHPEPGCPAVDMQSWSQAEFSEGVKSESAVLDSIRSVLPCLQTQTATYLSDLLGATHFFIPHHPEFDLYRSKRAKVTYLGSMPKPAQFAQPKWRTGAKLRVFAYLKADKQQVDTVVSALVLGGLDAVCFLSGSEEGAFAELAGDRLVISQTPYDLTDAMAQADLVICHAGLGVLSAAMYEACPVLLLPTQPEQIHNTLRAEGLGIGLGLRRGQTPESIMHVIQRLLTEPQWQARAQAVAQEYRSMAVSDPIGKIVELIEGALG